MKAISPVLACLGACAVLLTLAGAPAASARRAHGTHGTVRRLCSETAMKRWPGGPLVRRVAQGHDVRRYSYRGAWALGVAEDRSHARGYVLQSAFCPPSAKGRAALARDRAAPVGGHGVAQPLSHPISTRICAPDVWVRDHPIDRAIGILWTGDVFTSTRAARNPWHGGMAFGHENRRGWVPVSALCLGLPRRPAEMRMAASGDGAWLLAPPASMSCADRLVRRPLIEVGVDYPGRAGPVVRADLVRGRQVRTGPRFRPGEVRSLDRGAVGPFVCGHSQQVVYVVLSGPERGRRVAFTVTVGPRRVLARAASVVRSYRRPPAPGTSCAARPTLYFAHGHEGPVSHRYDARPAIAAGGAAIAFDSPLGLLPADADRARDVYVRRGGMLTLLSGGAASPATSRAPAISADGGRVAFESDVSTLVRGDQNGARDVFVADASEPLRRVSVDPSGGDSNGRSRAPSLSGDGRELAFESRATDLVTGAPVEGIYLADLAGHGVPPIRLLVAGAYRPALSADGGMLVFETARALSPRDTNQTWDVYALRVHGGRPMLVSATRSGRAGAGRSVAGVPSRGGRYVAFGSAAADLVPGDSRHGVRDVFRRDLRTGQTVLVSRDRCGGFANGYSRYPSISADGDRIAFDSHAEDIVSAATHGEGEIYLRDVRRARTMLVSRRPDGRPGSRTSFSPALSSDGTRVAFASFSADLVPGDANGKVDQFLAAPGRAPTRKIS